MVICFLLYERKGLISTPVSRSSCKRTCVVDNEYVHGKHRISNENGCIESSGIGIVGGRKCLENQEVFYVSISCHQRDCQEVKLRFIRLG